MVVAAAALAGLAVASIDGSVAAPGAPRDTRSERERVRQERAAAAADLDVLRATNAEVEAALADLNANVAGQEAALADARRAVQTAQAALAEAQAREAQAAADIDELQATLREVAVEAYINSGTLDEATAVLRTDDIDEAVQRRSLVDLRAGQYREVLDQLETVSEELALARADAEAAAQAAADHQAEVDRRLGEVRAARDQQAAVAAEVDARIESALAEAANLETLEAELSRQIAAEIAAEQAALAARTRAAGGGGGGGGTSRIVDNSGSMVTVRGPGGSITVHESIASSVAALLDAAAADGIVLAGGGYRSSESQWRLREQNCPDAANSPPSSCRPPTARPGRSMHERGLAIDFTYNGRVINSRSNDAFRWLSNNAASYGLYNLPSEPWHWSTNGN